MTSAPPAQVDPSPTAGAQRRSASTAVAWLVLGLLGLALVGASVPVRNARLQDCGAPMMFLLQGRSDAFPAADGTVPGDPGGPPLSPAEAASAAERPCHERVAARMVPVGALAIAAMVLGLAAAAVVLRRAWAARSTAAPARG